MSRARKTFQDFMPGTSVRDSSTCTAKQNIAKSEDLTEFHEQPTGNLVHHVFVDL